MKKVTRFYFLLAAACAALPAAARGADWEFDASANYDTGKYGTDKRADSVYIPFTFKDYYRFGEIAVTVPWLYQSSNGQLTRVGGLPVNPGKEGALSGRTTRESGPGDILVRGTYVIRTEDPRSFDLSLVGNLKLPTADKNKGLGTGELDQGLGAEFAKKISPWWSLRADGYYTIIGSPAGVNFNNQLAFDMGIFRELNKDLWLTALYETRSALVSGNADARDLRGTLAYKSPGGMQYTCGLVLGLSRGSPALGLSAGLSRRF